MNEQRKLRCAESLFQALWQRYRAQVSYAREYERIVTELGGRFVNDHVAFRTLQVPGAPLGLESIARVFRALGYQPQEAIEFPATRLHAIPLQPPTDSLPKVFVSELFVEQLEEPARGLLTAFATGARDRLDPTVLAALAAGEVDPRALEHLVASFTELPWRAFPPPTAEQVATVNAQTQYGAWVMLFGNNVNHFTASVNHHGVPELDTIEQVVATMQARGVPMKAEIEGAPGSRLRQTATQAARVSVPVAHGELEWPYAYFEIAERGEDPERPGELFQGFLGPQAAQLFDLTRSGDSR